MSDLGQDDWHWCPHCGEPKGICRCPLSQEKPMTDEHELARAWQDLNERCAPLGTNQRRILSNRMAAELNRQKAEIERLQAIVDWVDDLPVSEEELIND